MCGRERVQSTFGPIYKSIRTKSIRGINPQITQIPQIKQQKAESRKRYCLLPSAFWLFTV